MTRVPTRFYCTACKNQSHGVHCKRGDCSCKCRDMNYAEIKEFLSGKPDKQFTYTKESDDEFEKLLKSFKQTK